MKLRRLARLVRSLLPPVPWPIKGGGWLLVHGDEIGLTILLRRPYEENERAFVRRFLLPGMTFVDVGANQGIYAILAAKAIGPAGRVIAFEPAPSEVRKLRRNLRINRLSNVTVEQMALGSQGGSSEFFVCLSGRGSYSGLRLPDPRISARVRSIRVAVATLDAYVRTHGLARIDFMKLDAEGAELEVIRGASEVLSTFRPAILCELADVRTRRWGYAASEIYDLLSGSGYAWFRTAAGGALVAAPPKPSYDPAWENLIALPVEKLGQWDVAGGSSRHEHAPHGA